MRKKIAYMIVIACMLMMTGCKGSGSSTEESETVQRLSIWIAEDSTEIVEKTDEAIPDQELDKIQLGMKNWAQSTLGMDDNYSEENKKIILDKFYKMITIDSQRESIQKEQEAFFQDASVETSNVSATINNAYKAVSGKTTAGYVDGTVTITGTRDDENFEKTYNLIVLMDFGQDIASVYGVVSIEQK